MFGVEFLNSEKSVLISAFDRPLVFAFRGTVNVQNTSVVDRPAVGTVVFAAPIPTVAPPRLFVRLNSSRHSSMELYVVMNGSSGAWTGFTIYASAQGGGTLPLYVLDYVIARPSFREPTRTWGMQILEKGSERTLFSSDEYIVRFSKFTKKWTLSVSFSSDFSIIYYTYNSGVTIDIDDYIDVTFFNRGIVLQTIFDVTYTSVRIYDGGVRVLNLQTQSFSDSSAPKSVGDINFCTPICKFPASKYPS